MQLHIVEVATTLLLAMLMMPMQASASFGYSKKLNSKQNLEACYGPVVVKFLQRPLSADTRNGLIQAATDGVVAHAHIVAYDKYTGNIVDNFGLTGSFLKTDKASIFTESTSDIERLYDHNNPLGIIEMTKECYDNAKSKTLSQVEGWYYSELNNVNTKAYVAAGAAVGMFSGRPVSGAAMGANMAVNEYNKDGRHNYKIVEDDKSMMSFPGLNCQATINEFIKNVKEEPAETWNEILEYRQPGEERAVANSQRIDTPSDTEPMKQANTDKMAKRKVAKDCCACVDPKPKIVLPPTGLGWANCEKCDKLIGLVIVHYQSKNISVICDNPAGKAAIIKNLTSAFQGNNKSSYADFSIQ